MPSYHIKIKIEIDNKNIAGKLLNTWRLSKTLVNNTQVKKKFQDKFKNISNKMKIKVQLIKICGMQWNQCLEGNF